MIRIGSKQTRFLMPPPQALAALPPQQLRNNAHALSTPSDFPKA
jgi:hypothetical protein